jgi:hypothetical protein
LTPNNRLKIMAGLLLILTAGCKTPEYSQGRTQAIEPFANSSRGAIASGHPSKLRTGASTQPHDLDPPGGEHVLQTLLAAKPMVLSTDDEKTLSPKFHFVLSVSKRTADGELPQATLPWTDIWVVRDGGNVGILCASASGLPYCYMTEGLFIVMDRAHPGTLLFCEGGRPALVLGAEPKTQSAVFELEYGSADEPAALTLDLSAILRSVQAKLRHADFNTANRSLMVATENAAVTITLSPDAKSGVPIQSFLSTSRASGSSIAINDIAIGSDPPLNLLGVDVQAVAALGLPMRRLALRDAKTLNLLVPADFCVAPEERAAAKTLMQLFFGGGKRPDPPPVRHGKAGPNRA